MNIKTFVSVGRAALCLPFFLGGPIVPSLRAAELDRVKIGRPSLSMNFMQPLLARKAGIDRQEGIWGDVIQMQTPVAIAALIAGDVDYTLAFESSVNAVLKGAPIIGIEIYQIRLPQVIVARPEIRSFADLKGKNAAVPDLSSSGLNGFRQILRSHGLNDKDYNMVVVGSEPNRLNSLVTDRLQFTWFSPPFHMKALKAGMKALSGTKDFVKSPNGIATSLKKIKEHKEQVKKLLRMFVQTNRWMRSHPDETIDFLMSQYKLDRETAASSYDLYLPTLSDNGQIEDEYIQEIIDRWRQQTGSSATVPLERVRDFSIVKEVAGELGPR
jgi:ABC-type nitrate/sulfonate/bicarbonate transport system substrate-binding protein